MPIRDKANRAPGVQDTFQTPPHAIECLLPFLDVYQDVVHPKGTHGGHDMIRTTLIWESACGREELLSGALADMGYQVHSTDIQHGDVFDFFTYTPAMHVDYHITNPPYSLKYKWLQRSFELGIPFALLLPSDTICAATFARMFEKYNEEPWRIEVISPKRRFNYKAPIRGWADSNAQMHTSWITWGLHVEELSRSEPLRTFYVDVRNPKYDENNNEIA